MCCSALILIKAVTYIEAIWKTYCCGDTRPNGVTEDHIVLVVWIFSLLQEVMMACIVGMFIDPAASFHLDRTAMVEVGLQMWLVCGGFTGAAFEVIVLRERDLQ